jgi:carbamate kinase
MRPAARDFPRRRRRANSSKHRAQRRCSPTFGKDGAVNRGSQPVLVALGGNALVLPGEQPTIGTQFRNAEAAMCAIAPLIERGERVVITHGNGFQVGHILIRAEEALGKAYALPLEVCVAESQGEVGYLLEQALHNVLIERGVRLPIVGVLTQAVVAADDPAFAKPTKPIGPPLDAPGAERLRRAGLAVVEEAGRGWRRVVASPRPRAIADVEPIGWLLERGAVVIAAGGGGIPVTRDADGRLRGVAAVIDKDFASLVLAQAIGARELLILTGEPAVYSDYRGPEQRPLRRLDPPAARRFAAQGHFPPGSMGPKVEAAVGFVEAGGQRAVITSAARLGAALRGEDGTTIERQRI